MVGNSKNQQNKNTILSTSNSYSYLYNNNEKNDKIKNSNVLLFGNPNNLSNTIYLNINDEKPKSLFNIEQKNENSNGLLNINSTNSSKGIAFPNNINDNNNEINNKINDGNELNENKKISLNTNQLFPVKKEENDKNTNLFGINDNKNSIFGTNDNKNSIFGTNDNNKSLFEKSQDKNTEKKEVLSSNNDNSNLNIFNHSKNNNSLFKNKNEENSTLFFSVPEEKKNILNDKSSSITESSIDYIPNKRKKISEEDNFYSLMKETKLSKQKKITFNIKPEIIKKEEKIGNENLLFSVPKDKKGELNYKSILTTEPIFGFKKEEKKDNENLLFSVPKDKKENISSTTEIISSPSPILNNIKDEKIKIDIKSIPLTAIIDINKQTDIELKCR